MSDKKIGFVTGKVYYYDAPGILQTVGKKEHPVLWNGGHIGAKIKDNGQFEKVRELPFADDIFTLVRREMYNEIGGYDTTFFCNRKSMTGRQGRKRKDIKYIIPLKQKYGIKKA